MNTNSSLNEVVVNLVDGPSRDRLIDAFKYAEDDSTLVPVDFYTKSKEKIPIVPTMLEHEDGSGHSFNGHGYVTVDTIAGHKLYDKHIYFYFYTASDRHGYIKFKEQQN